MRLRLASAAALLLAACSGQTANRQEGANGQAAGAGATSAPAAAATPTGGSGSLTIQPGLWEVTMSIESSEMSGMPAGMPAPHIPPTTVRSCVTPEQVARANASFLAGGSNRGGMECDYSGVTVADGRIQGHSVCRRPGMEANVTMDGSFTPTSYDVNEQMQSTMHGREMRSTNHLVGRRIGECTPGQESAAAPAPAGDRAGE